MTTLTNSADSPGEPIAIEPGDFVVYHSQAKVASFAALFLLGLPLMPYMFFFKALPRHDGRVVFAAVFTVCIVLFLGFCVFTAVRLLLTLRSPQPRPAVVINDRGFLDQTKIGGGLGWVSWEDVTLLSIEPSGRFLCITLKNEETYLKRHPKWGRLNMWLRKIGPEGTPLAIMNTLLAISLPDFLAQMMKYQAQYLQNQDPQQKPVDTV